MTTEKKEIIDYVDDPTINEPLHHIKWIHYTHLKSNDYNPNYVQKKEMQLLTLSILKHGWLQPIIINKDYIIIDGFHRATIIRTQKKVQERTRGFIPCIILDLPDTECKFMTIRMNRAKGTHTAYKMHEVISDLYKNGHTRKQIAHEIGANMEEVDLLLQENVFTHLGIDDNTKYSQAWIPK